MSADLPEGVGLDEVRQHKATVGIVAMLLNVSGAYMVAEDGSAEEALAERVFEDCITQVVGMGDEGVGKVILTMLALIEATVPQEAAQEWFDFQSAKITEALVTDG